MDSTLIAAIIGAVGTVVAAIITVVATTRKHSPPLHGTSTPDTAPSRMEQQCPSDHVTPAPVTTAPDSPAMKPVVESRVELKDLLPVPGNEKGMTFEQVIAAIRHLQPDASLGRTAEQGQYFERARHLTNYQMYEDDPLRYGAVQPNGKTMWLYLGKQGKIYCGDKPWD